MARAFRDLPRFQGMLLVGACAAYLAAIVIGGVISYGMAAREDSRQQQDAARRAEPVPPADVLRVPEVVVENIPANANTARPQLAQLVQKIRAHDTREPDGFVKHLIKDRRDLQGLPFQMGGACRMNPGLVNSFAAAVAITHETLQSEGSFFNKADSVDTFLERWGGQDAGSGVAALSQIYGAEKLSRRESLARHLKVVNHPSATRALARSAVFDFDQHVRSAAIASLKRRPKQDYTDVLLAGLRHPLPMAAKNASRAIVRLHRKDLVPQLVAFLAEPNPRDPFDHAINGQPVTAVREVVKVNHHRNCLLCHPPAAAGTTASPGTVFAAVPTPGVPFPSPDSGQPYGGSPGDPVIRADITYLRQDFSALVAVANAQPWPAMQRFDFLVRTRVLTDAEASEQVKEKQARPAGQLSENHQAALLALRQLTAQDAGTTAEAWRRALDLPAPAAKQ